MGPHWGPALPRILFLCLLEMIHWYPTPHLETSVCYIRRCCSHLAMNWKHGAGKQHLSGPGGGRTWLVEMSLFFTTYNKMDFTPHPLHWSHDLLNRTCAKGDAFDWTLRLSTSFLSTKSKPNYNSLCSLVFLATRERFLACELERYAAHAPRDKSKGDQAPTR
jgi:hypothetical protein